MDTLIKRLELVSLQKKVMLQKGSKLNSILKGSCPQCQDESMYIEKNIFNLPKILKMNENCSHCGLKYQIEPSFFYGAMYVGYGLNVGVMVTVFLVAFFGFQANVNQTFVAIVVVLLVLFPIISRLSRNIYINMFVSFKKKS